MSDKEKINYKWYFNIWKEFFESKGFKQVSFENLMDDFYICFFGKVNDSSALRVDVYAGNYRTDTKINGCIGIDFVKNYNKLSQMPIYTDLDIEEETLWNAILILVENEKNFPEKYSSIKQDEHGNWLLIEWKDEE